MVRGEDIASNMYDRLLRRISAFLLVLGVCMGLSTQVPGPCAQSGSTTPWIAEVGMATGQPGGAVSGYGTATSAWAWFAGLMFMPVLAAPDEETGGVAVSTELREIVLDEMRDVDRWFLIPSDIVEAGSTVVLTSASAQPPPGSAEYVVLRADARPTAAYLGIGSSIAGRGTFARKLTAWIRNNASPVALSLVVEDGSGRWWEHEPVTIQGDAWTRTEWDLDARERWTPLRRRGEPLSPKQRPVVLRQIRFYPEAGSTAAEDRRIRVGVGRICAWLPVRGLESVEASIQTPRPADTFTGNEPARLQVRLRNLGEAPLTATGQLQAEPLIGETAIAPLGMLYLPPGAVVTRDVVVPARAFGPYEVRLKLQTGNQELVWRGKFARVRAEGVRAYSLPGTFGCSGNVAGFAREQEPVVVRWNRLTGMSWTRFGLAWDQVNPAPGVWAWSLPQSVAGPRGSALRTGGRVYETPVVADTGPVDEITVAFWARCPTPSRRMVWPVVRSDDSGRRSYGAFIHPGNGRMHFSFTFRKEPDVSVELDFGESAWDGQWHHYAATYSSHIRQLALYVDGALKTTAFQDGGPINTMPVPLRVGVGGPVDIDEVVVHRRALGHADIAALARKTAPPQDGLAAWWSFDDATRPLDAIVPLGARLTVQEPDAIRWAREARRQGMRPVVILGFPPLWATAQARGASHPSSAELPDPTYWREYVTQVTRRYRGLIDTWEIWHEPNNPAYWPAPPDARAYFTVLKVAYEAARRGNPACTVLMPALSGPDEAGNGLSYLFRLLELGAGRYCDAISLHPYRSSSPEESRLVDQLREIGRRAGESGRVRKIWFTEYSWPTHVSGGFSERLQAALLARTAILALASGHVERLLWYRLHDSGPDRTGMQDNFGLCDDKLHPKAAFFAHRTIAMLLNRAVPIASGRPTSGTHLALFRSGNERLAAVWSVDQPRTLAFVIGRPRVQVTDLMGNSRLIDTDDGTLLLAVDELPVFLRYLRPQARFAGEPLTLSIGRGGQAIEGRVVVRNVFGTARQVQLRVQADVAGSRPFETERTLPRGGTATVSFRISVPSDWPSGGVSLSAQAEFKRADERGTSRSAAVKANYRIPAAND